MTQINSNYARVLKHRIKTQDIPNFNHLQKVKDQLTSAELKFFVEKAKAKYDTLLLQNDTKKEEVTSSAEN